MNMQRTPSISVAICTKDRLESLAIALESLTLPQWSGHWELVIVDNSRTDNESQPGDVAALAETFTNRIPAVIRIVREGRTGISRARNRALRECRADIVIFLDDDVTCSPDLVAAYAHAFEDPKLVCAGGRIQPVFDDSTPDWFRTEALSIQGGPTARYDFGETDCAIGDQIALLPIGGNCGCRREAAIKVGGFNEEIGYGGIQVGPGEETDLFRRLLVEETGTARYIANAKVQHRIGARTTMKYFKTWYEDLGYLDAYLRIVESDGHITARDIGRCAQRVATWQLRLLYERDTRKRVAAIRRLSRAKGLLKGLASRKFSNSWTSR